MNGFRFPEPLSDRGDRCRAAVWIAACVALGIAFNVLGIARVLLPGTF